MRIKNSRQTNASRRGKIAWVRGKKDRTSWVTLRVCWRLRAGSRDCDCEMERAGSPHSLGGTKAERGRDPAVAGQAHVRSMANDASWGGRHHSESDGYCTGGRCVLGRTHHSESDGYCTGGRCGQVRSECPRSAREGARGRTGHEMGVPRGRKTRHARRVRSMADDAFWGGRITRRVMDTVLADVALSPPRYAWGPCALPSLAPSPAPEGRKKSSRGRSEAWRARTPGLANNQRCGKRCALKGREKGTRTETSTPPTPQARRRSANILFASPSQRPGVLDTPVRRTVFITLRVMRPPPAIFVRYRRSSPQHSRFSPRPSHVQDGATVHGPPRFRPGT
ncbi:hypothetical protein HNQ64_001695 [Prosthecobacter dejongeii]|uniref:Uncharacterized protein n=1 Tax=Prosthecobacter dejongeii TaxID=48465 RepID=A0A7W8DPZ6_9BACT|nr:hypothetical protein [Prosthecobacter dejongeii]